MSNVSVMLKIEAPADEVWKVLGDFNAMPKWMPGIETSEVDGEGVGTTRSVTSARVGTIKEKLETYDDAARSFSYRVIEGDLPATNFNGRMQVISEGDGVCKVFWSCSFDPKNGPPSDVEERFNKIFIQSLENLAKVVGG